MLFSKRNLCYFGCKWKENSHLELKSILIDKKILSDFYTLNDMLISSILHKKK